MLAPEAAGVGAVGAVVAAGTLLGLVAGALYVRARSKSTGFGFSTFQVKCDGAVGQRVGRVLEPPPDEVFTLLLLPGGRQC